MAFSYACLTLQRVVLPILLVLAALMRPVGISFVYLLMFFISPFIPVATKHNFKGSVTAYLIILLALSTIVLLCHISLQVIIFALQINDSVFGKCSFTEQLLRHIGFIDFQNLRALAVTEWLLPEVLIMISSLVVYLVTKRLTTESVPGHLENGEAPEARESIVAAAATADGAPVVTPATAEHNNGATGSAAAKRGSDSERPNFDGLIKISPLFCLATLFFAAVLRPSVPGGFYFLIFLLSGSYWATFQSLKRGFAVILRFVMVVIVLHTICIVAYQTPWMQDHLSKDNLIARLLGLEPLIISSCANDIRVIIYNSLYKADSFINPIVLFFTYYALALTTKNLIKPRIVAKPATAFGQQLENGSKKINRQLSLITQASSSASRGSKKESSWSNKTQRLNVSLRREPRPTNINESTETTPLVRQHTRRARTTSKLEAYTDIANASRESGIPLDNLDNVQQAANDDDHASFCEQLTYGFISIGSFIYQNSYIFTNILMMAWSIVYHSWLTFVLLLGGNILWMIPNQRKAMMRTSPVIVIYAEILLVAQYIYGMDLHNDELPSKVNITGINLEQIGLDRPQEHDMQPCVPLIVKTLFVLMFWITLRQYFKEKADNRRTSTIANMFAPVQLTVSATSDGLTADRVDNKKTSKFLKKAGSVIKNLLVRMWIWLLVLVIFLCAITGSDMTGFRICYMGLFLFFLLVFQSSSKAWVRIMYGFWLFLIFYAMSILILIYTYQFDKFPQYWNDYLNISITLQKDIGLEIYKTKDLFLHLLSPTLIVILTVIQVHYFHTRFIDSLEQPLITADISDVTVTSKAKRTVESRLSTAASKCPPSVQRIFKKLGKQIKSFLISFKKLFWTFLELHIMKAVYIVAFVCSASEVCLMHIVFVGLCVMGVISRTNVQVIISRIISFIVTLIILIKMIYQVAYLEHHKYNVTCVNDQNTSETSNNAVWFGLEKTPVNGSLMSLLKQYIIYMVMVTLHAVVSLRQLQMHRQTGILEDSRYAVLFPKIKRADAEKNLKGMFKYLCNYGFYKFGFEICLIMLVITVSYRQDVIAVVYVGWLLILLLFDRARSAKVLELFQYFVAILIFMQYIFFVGLPPGLCLNYPWNDEIYGDSIQRWALLPGNLHLSHAKKLIFDFVMLMLLNRQLRVFKLEARLDRNKEQYAGGSNKSVIDDIANLGKMPFDNPTRDFLSHIRNYLDIFKNIILCGFYWITLAMIFLAGTNIYGFLKLGYLIGAFIFLWQGSDFYLRPIHTIIKRWQYLIYYNVANILIKTWLQMAGCLFMQQLAKHCCWLVHLLGIACVTKQAKPIEAAMVEELYGDKYDDCPATNANYFLLWDSLCFAFLIFQLRIFKSHYFCHIIIDTKANSILASRGAEIIEDLRLKQIQHRHGHEKEVLYKIKRKMEKIRATQKKMLRPTAKHGDDEEPEIVLLPKILRAPLAHNSSFSSCQGSGYRTPDDNSDDGSVSDSSSSTTSHSSAERTASTSSTEEHAQLLDSPDTLQEVRIVGGDDYASGSQTIYADINSVSDGGEGRGGAHNTPVRGGLMERLRLPDIDIQVTPQHTTPSSDLLTMPFEGFLDMNRLSVGSAPNSDLVGPSLQKDSDEEFSEVFSPTPYVSIQPPSMPSLLLLPPISGGGATSCSLNVNVSGGSSVISSNLTVSGAAGDLRPGRHQRNASVNAVSWSETVSIKCAPDEAAVSAELNEDIPVTLRDKSLHRRHLSMGNASYSMEEQNAARRRSSNVSWAREETQLRAAARPNSWGPVEYGYPVTTGTQPTQRTKIQSHPQAIRAGDYYMFEDMDEKFELDLIEDEVDFLDDHDKIIESEKKMSRRKTLADVWKDIQSAEYRRQVYVRQRSYASAPGSRIGLKIDEEFIDTQSGGIGGIGDGSGGPDAVGVRTSTLSEPLNFVHRSTSEYFEQVTKTDGSAKDNEPSTSAKSTAASEELAEARKKTETDSGTELPEPEEDVLPGNPIMRLLEALLVCIVMRLNRFSRNYRYVNKILAEEKRALKESQTEFNRLGDSGAASMFSMMKKNFESDELADTTATTSKNALILPTPITSTTTTTTPPTTATATTPPSLLPDQNQQQIALSEQPDPHIVDIIAMPFDTVDARTDFRTEPSSSNSLTRGRKSADCQSLRPDIRRLRVPSVERHWQQDVVMSRQWSFEKLDSTAEYAFEEEDFVARDHNICIEVLISSWYAILSNTDLICYVVVFINQVVNASIISLPIPFMVFLWGTLSLPRPTKTFWVTLIAYTQAVVLVKCIFQYKLIWANYNNVPHQPLAPAKIFGVELNPNYASYDLVLLLVLFFHRFILKSQGLWRSEYQETGVLVQTNSSDKDIGTIDAEETSALQPGTPVPEREIQVSNTQSAVSLADSVKDMNITRFKRARYASSLCKFFHNLTKKTRLPSDVYALMFVCDFINFFILLFGFPSFSSRQVEGQGGVETYLAENKVPVPFLIMLLVQFLLIVIDRALYLRKALIPKIVFHFISVIGIHIWMFFVVPAVTERSFYHLGPPIAFYIFKCFYMLLSSYQIKCGYPKRILGNFLTKNFSLLNMMTFKTYRLIPFLYELRTVLDWVCTDTTMTIFDWLKMEDIFGDIFFIKCSRKMETDFPAMRAQKKALVSKLIMGGTGILAIFILIWGPLCIFALFNAVGISNLPYEVSISIRIGSYNPIYQTVNRESTICFEKEDLERMQNAYTKDNAKYFLSTYDASDVAAIKLAGNSPSLWTISPPDKDRLVKELIGSETTLTARFTYSFQREPPAKDQPRSVGSEITADLLKGDASRTALGEVIQTSNSSTTVLLPALMPKFIKVLNSGEVTVVQSLMPDDSIYRPVVVKIHHTETEVWWEIRDYCEDNFHSNVLSKLPKVDCDSGIVLYLFNDKKFPSTLSMFTGGGILGLYVTVVMVASQVIKGFISGQNRKIMFEDLPYVDRVLQLCLDIYLVREALEFALEEDLFAKLLFLYRSPETMIKWTRPKEDTNDDDTDSESVRSRREHLPQQQH